MDMAIQLIAFMTVYSSLVHGHDTTMDDFFSVYWTLEEELMNAASFEPFEECRRYLEDVVDSCDEDNFNISTRLTINADEASVSIGNRKSFYHVQFLTNGTVLSEKCGTNTGVEESRGSTSRSVTTMSDYLSESCNVRQEALGFMSILGVGICKNTLQEMKDMCTLQNCNFTTTLIASLEYVTFEIMNRDYKYGISYSIDVSSNYIRDINQECSKDAASGHCTCPGLGVSCADVPATVGPANFDFQGSTTTEQSRGVLEIAGFIVLGVAIGTIITTAISCAIIRVQLKNLSSKTPAHRKTESTANKFDNSTYSAVHTGLYETTDEPEERLKPHSHPPRRPVPALPGIYDSPMYHGQPDDIYSCIQDVSRYHDDAHARGDNEHGMSKSHHVHSHQYRKYPKKAYDNATNVHIELDDIYDPGKGTDYDHMPGSRKDIKHKRPEVRSPVNYGENTDQDLHFRKGKYLNLEKEKGRQRKVIELQDVAVNDSKKDAYFILEKQSKRNAK